MTKEEVVGLTSLRVLSSQRETGRRCLSNELTTLVSYLALHIAQTPPAAHHFALGLKTSLPDRQEEIDLQFHGCEGFLRRKCARERHSHRGVRNVAKNSAVQRAHRVCMPWSGCQRDYGASIGNLFRFKSNQPRHGNSVCFRSSPKISFQGNLRRTHDFPACFFDFFARMFVSRYSSR